MNGHVIKNQNGLHYLTLTVVGWLDVLSREDYRKVLMESLAYCQKEKGLVLNAYVIMSNHIHLIGYAKEGYALSDILRDFKKYTAKTIIQQIIQQIIQHPKESRSEWMLRLFKYYAKYKSDNNTYQFWQKSNYPIELATPKWILQKLDYLHLNPVRNGLVELPEHYLYSSARQYVGEEVLLEVELIDLGSTYGYVDV